MKIQDTKLFTDGWRVAYRKKCGDILTDDLNSPFAVIKNPSGSWAADPFIFEKNNKVYIFCEIYNFIKGKGAIGFYEVGAKEKKWVTVIEEPYHMSYPFVFEEKGEVYLIPETSAGHELCCYRAIEFPHQWKKEKILRSEVSYVDTTPFKFKDKKYALSYNVGNDEQYELMLLDIDEPEKDCNIKVKDVNLRRPAGKVCEKRNVRSAQDCIESYGKGIVFYRYQITDDGAFKEEEIGRVYAEDIRLNKKIYVKGIHTYNFSENYEVIDIRTRYINVIRLVNKILRRRKSR